MYISRIHIQGFRGFCDTQIDFYEGLNVLIGENNAGKSTVILALRLVLDRRSRPRLTAYDFCRQGVDVNAPPQISISVVLEQTNHESPEDKAVVATWLTRLTPKWQATLTFRYFLPDEMLDKFKSAVSKAQGSESSAISDADYWSIVEAYLPHFVSRIYGGKPESANRAESEWLEKLDLVTLDAVRDAESKMLTGSNLMLRQVLMKALDHDVDDNDEERERREADFRKKSADLVQDLRKPRPSIWSRRSGACLVRHQILKGLQLRQIFWVPCDW